MLHVFRDYGPFTYVYHIAAYAAEGMSHFIRKFNYRNNLVTSVALLNEAVRSDVDCFVFTSSIAAYGAAQTPMIETTTPEPEDPYGISKYAMELDLKAAKHMFDIDHVIFRPHNVYGPNQNIYDRYRNVIGIFMQQILSSKPMTIFGDGTQTRAFSYIDDVAPAIAMSPLLRTARNEVFNVGADQPYTLNELADEVAQAMNVTKNVVYLDARKEVLHAQSDHSKVKCFFHLNDAVTLHDGIHRMAEWVKKTGKKFTPVEFDEVEVLEGMPPSWITESMKKNEAIKQERIKTRTTVQNTNDNVKNEL
jgi:UDP-glucose 4-epimerase